eukprot:6211775-Pleurochrysis_carterae.AAC.1
MSCSTTCSKRNNCSKKWHHVANFGAPVKAITNIGSNEGSRQRGGGRASEVSTVIAAEHLKMRVQRDLARARARGSNNMLDSA